MAQPKAVDEMAEDLPIESYIASLNDKLITVLGPDAIAYRLWPSIHASGDFLWFLFSPAPPRGTSDDPY
jgi:hypothetical protein